MPYCMPQRNTYFLPQWECSPPPLINLVTVTAFSCRAIVRWRDWSQCLPNDCQRWGTLKSSHCFGSNHTPRFDSNSSSKSHNQPRSCDPAWIMWWGPGQARAVLPDDITCGITSSSSCLPLTKNPPYGAVFVGQFHSWEKSLSNVIKVSSFVIQ